MFSSKYFRIGILFAFGVLGIWLFSQSATLTPETISRQEAQMALAPGRSGDSSPVVDLMTDDPRPIRGEAVFPAIVDASKLPSRPSEVDRLLEQYKNGEIDIEINEGLYSESVVRALIAESEKQPVDKSVQNYSQNMMATLSSGASFKAIDYTQSQQGVPPDPDITVGTNHVVVGVNTSFQVFDKSGNSLVGPTLFEDFWGSNCGTGNATMTFFDPFLDYDEKENRYILGITAYDTAVNGGDNGWACIAVSQTDNAASNWYLYSFDGNPGGGADYFFDYPHLGVGQQALYLSANMFGASFVRNHVFAYDKVAMYAGLAANSVKFNVGSSNFTLQPAKMHGFNSGAWPTNVNEPHYFIDAQYGNNQNTLTVWQLSDPWGSPSLTTAGTVTVNSYSLPVNQKQLGGSDLQGNDDRLLDAKYWGGKLYTTHTIGCNPGGGTVNCVRWYELDISSGSPSLVDQGTFSSSGEGRSFPAIATNACGDLLVGYTKTSTSIYPSVYVAGRESTDPAGQLKDETLLHAGEDFYTAYDSVPRRWGDYTGMAIDPDGVTFWYLGEYSRNQATARWSTWVGSFSWPSCSIGPTPTPGPTATVTNTPPPTATPGPVTCTTFNSSDVPKSISSSGTPSISSVLNIASGGTIQDVNVLNLAGTHTYVSDLDFNLTSPQGTEIQIFAPSSCGSLDNFDLNLDDSATGSAPCPPTGGGTYLPDNALSVFNGQDSIGTWTLRVDDNFNLDGGSLDSWSLEICVEDVGGPTPTNTPVPPTATNTPIPTNTTVPPTATNTPIPTNTTVPPTATNTPIPPTATSTPLPPSGEVIYVSSTSGGNVGGVAFSDEDILAYDTSSGTWSKFWDGSTVGVTRDLNAFYMISTNEILMSFNVAFTLPGGLSIDDSDIVLYNVSANTFSMYFDGSTAGLTTNAEDIDAIHLTTSGDLIISTLGNPGVPGLSGVRDEDMILYDGSNWSAYFDGSDVGLGTSSSEDVYGTWVDAVTGDIYLTTAGAFSVTGLSGDGADIFVCGSPVTGVNTSCTFGSSVYWDGSALGFAGEVMDGFHIIR